MTNFTWSIQYKHLDFPRDIIEYYTYIESLVDELWLYPLHFPLEHIEAPRRQLDFVSRKFDFPKIKSLKEQHPKIVTIFAGMSASNEVTITNYDGLIIHSKHVNVHYDGPKLILDSKILDSHNYIAASDLVITKAGWTTVSECVKSRVKMILIERPSALEDTHIINQIKQLQLGTSITESDLKKLDINSYL